MNPNPTATIDVFAAVIDTTPAHEEAARLFAEGRDLHEIARRVEVTVDTVVAWHEHHFGFQAKCLLFEYLAARREWALARAANSRRLHAELASLDEMLDLGLGGMAAVPNPTSPLAFRYLDPPPDAWTLLRRAVDTEVAAAETEARQRNLQATVPVPGFERCDRDLVTVDLVTRNAAEIAARTQRSTP